MILMKRFFKLPSYEITEPSTENPLNVKPTCQQIRFVP